MKQNDNAGYPVRVGAIDVGSNGIRVRAVEFSDPSRFELLEEGRAAVRLGADAFDSGRFGKATLDAAVAAVAEHRAALERLEVERYRCVATSAVRESENGAEFARRLDQEADVALDVIDGVEEARLVWVAVRDRVDLDGGKWLLVDLGGGSVEVSLVDEERVHWSVTHPMGAVRLLQELEGAEHPKKKLRKLLNQYVKDLDLPRRVSELRLEGMIASGGNIDELATLATPELDDRGVARPTLKQLREAREKLDRMSVKQRIEKLALRPDRADVIVPAASVYLKLAAIAEVEELVVPHVGVKEGILLDLAQNPASGQPLRAVERQR